MLVSSGCLGPQLAAEVELGEPVELVDTVGWP